MRSLLKILCALALAGFGATCVASPSAPVNGVEYMTLAEVQNTDAGNKIEVIEFFAYYCPHCNSFEPSLSAWVKQQGDKIAFKRVHVAHSPGVKAQQRLYYTLDSLAMVPAYHEKVFAAMHEQQRLRLATDEEVFDWATKAGIDRTKFIDVYRSFGVQAKARRADEMMVSYKVSQWPLIAIDGRYVTSPYIAGQGSPASATEAEQQKMALQVMDHLVAKAKAEKK